MPYIQTKPLHPTQRMKKMENGNYEIRIQVIPNHDLISLLLSYGQDIVVISPSSLKYKLQSIIEKMSANYH
jgi:predicted DNA-binding transcriptional regulator YafY